jgi:hypothetical protein
LGRRDRYQNVQVGPPLPPSLEAQPAAETRDALAHAEKTHARSDGVIIGSAVILDGEFDFAGDAVASNGRGLLHGEMKDNPCCPCVLRRIGDRLLRDAIETVADGSGQALEIA